MDLARIIFRNLGRNSRRTAMTIMSIAVSLFTFETCPLKVRVAQISGFTSPTEHDAPVARLACARFLRAARTKG